jgi:uncharacterized protein YbbK (DUF523 family)
MRKVLVGISSCLLGEKVRYDGRDKHDPYITGTLGQIFRFVPVCPEKESGMPVPREAMQLTGDLAAPRLVTITSGRDLTGQMDQYCCKKLEELAGMELGGFILKAGSPSCGLYGIKLFNPLDGTVAGAGSGLFAAALKARFPALPVVDEAELADQATAEKFVSMVMQYLNCQKQRQFDQADQL